MSKEDVKVERVINALKNWSPNGLCGGTLVQANGQRAKTEACAIGCLALDFAVSRRGREFFQKDGGDRKMFFRKYIYNNAGLPPGKFKDAVQKYFGISDETMAQMMDYNDSCVANGGTPDDEQREHVPTAIRKTIYSLRKRFEKWDEKRTDEDRDEAQGL